MKVIFHIDEAERWNRVFMNVGNFLRDVEPGKVNMEVLANGAGVTGYTQGQEAVLARMKELHGQGVVFAACRNALQLHNIREEALPDFVTVVTAGITEIVKKQAEGYAYIKP